MKKTLLFVKSIVLIVLISVAVYAGVTLQYFTAKPNAEGILVEWKTMDEAGTVSFEIERSANTPDNFIGIKSINASGNNSYYTYQDDGVTLNPNNPKTSSIYFYRLKCITGNGTYSYSPTISVTHSVSGIKSTWGSIKAIFR
ncbi:MAG TPA: hypothetical protein VIL99_07075 [Ignavibacteria bacterium]|jgi:hypothetical protein